MIESIAGAEVGGGVAFLTVAKEGDIRIWTLEQERHSISLNNNISKAVVSKIGEGELISEISGHPRGTMESHRLQD